MFLAILVVLIGRFTIAAMRLIALTADNRLDETKLNLMSLLTWAGLRGGSAVAFAMSLPRGDATGASACNKLWDCRILHHRPGPHRWPDVLATAATAHCKNSIAASSRTNRSSG